ncbi:MAG: hypothetical protein HYT76_10450 [Deltaproteobacteria bacterium]|nr:hypothetical protein [Deltaproteobacteria bacterium]
MGQQIWMVMGLGLGGWELASSCISLEKIRNTDEPEKYQKKLFFNLFGVISGGLTGLHFFSLRRENFSLARTTAKIGLPLCLIQILCGLSVIHQQDVWRILRIARQDDRKYRDEDPVKLLDFVPIGLQLASFALGLGYTHFSILGLLERAMAGERSAFSDLYFKARGGNLSAHTALIEIGKEKPVFFAPPFDDLLFPHWLTQQDGRAILEKGLKDTRMGFLMRRAITDKPDLFQKADINKTLESLRLFDWGPAELNVLIAHRSDLAKTVLEQAPLVFKGEDWAKFGPTLRGIYTGNLDDAARARFVADWEQKLLTGVDNGMRPFRDLYRACDPEKYQGLVEKYLAEVTDWRLAATPLMEDAMLYVRTTSSPDGIGRVAALAGVISERKDFDNGAADLRKTVLSLLARSVKGRDY